MPLEDRVITTDLLRTQADLDIDDAQVLLPAGVLDTLQDPALHLVVPAGHAVGADIDKLVVQLILDTRRGELRLNTLVEHDWFAGLPTAYQVLVNVREVVPEAVQADLEDWEEEPS